MIALIQDHWFLISSAQADSCSSSFHFRVQESLNGQISLCVPVFLVSVSLPMLNSLNSYRCSGLIFNANSCPVPLLSRNIFSLNTFFPICLKSDPSFFIFFIYLSACSPASGQPFPVVWIKRLCSCTMVRSVGFGWSGFKAYYCSFGSKPTNVSSWTGCYYVWGGWNTFSTPHIRSKFTNNEPLPAALAHVSWNRDDDLWG